MVFVLYLPIGEFPTACYSERVATTKTIPWQLPDGRTVAVHWRSSWRSQHLRLSVRGNIVNISTPPLVPAWLIKRYLTEQAVWITSHLASAGVGSHHLLYEGRSWVVVCHPPGTPHTDPVQLHEETAHLYPVQATAASAQRLLERWLQSQAAAVAAPLLQEQAHIMGLTVPVLRFRETKSRWGSCSATGIITLNWRLIQAPTAVMRYVIIHELSHRVHLNHSPRFWQLVEKYDPAYRLHRGWLKRHGAECVTPSFNL